MSIVKNLKKVMTGSVISQIIAIASLPIITKLYSPEDLGFYAICLSIVSIIGMVSALRLERALFTLHGSELYNVRLSGAISVSFLCSIIISLFLLFIIYNEYIEIGENIVPYIFFWGWGTSIIQTLLMSSSSFGKFSLISKVSIIRSLCVFLLQVLLFFIFSPQYALILSGIISVYISVVLLVKSSAASLRLINPIKYIIINRVDCFNGFLQSSFSAISNNFPIIIISQLWGVKAAGLFMLSEKCIRIPINLISNNLRPVLANHFQNSSNSKISSIFKISSYLFVISLFFSFLIIVTIDDTIILFLSDEWLESSDLMKILSFWMVFNFTVLPFQSYNIHFINMKYTTYNEALTLMFKMLGLYICYSIGGDMYYACIVIVISSMVSLFLNIITTSTKLKVTN